MAASSPFVQAWRIECLSEGDGEAVLRLPLQPMHLNSIGTVHGGVVASLADTACGIALLSVAPPHARFVTASLNVSYMGAAQGAYIDAEAAVTAVRKRVAFVEATLKDAAGEVIARGSVVFSISTASAAV